MNGFFDRMRAGMQRFLSGRYGRDQFSTALLIVAVVLFILSITTRLMIFWILSCACLVYIYFRIFSRDYAKRSAENNWYLAKTASFRKMLRVQKKRFDGRKDYRFFKCPGCGQEVRVPKGKGHIRITCPKCSVQFDRTV